MKKIKRLFAGLLRINRILFPLIIIISFLLFSLETLKYSGFVKRYFFVAPRNLLIVCFLSTLLLFYSRLLKSETVRWRKIEKIIFATNFVLSPLILLFSYVLEFLEQTKYQNYVFSTFHLNLSGFLYIICLNFILLIYQFSVIGLQENYKLKVELPKKRKFLKYISGLKKLSVKRFVISLIRKAKDNSIFVAVFVLLLLIVLYTFKDYGIGWDTGITLDMGNDAAKFYASLGKNMAYLSNYSQPQYAIYGQFIETIRYFVSQMFHNNSIEFYYLYIGLISLLTFYFIYKTVYLITKNKIFSSISPLFLLFIPRFFGDMFNNTKDIGPAIFVSIIIYLSVLIFHNFYKIRGRWLIFLGVAIGIGATLRISLLYLLPLFLAFYFTLFLKSKRNFKLLISDVFWLIATVFVTIHICTPYLLTTRPILGLVDMFIVSQKYPWPGTVLYGGKYILSTQLPWQYLPNWILITTPLFILFFSIVFLLFILTKIILKRGRSKDWFIGLCGSFIILCYLVPILAVVVMKPSLYDAWRQFLFLSVPLALMAALGFYYSVVFLGRRPVLKLAVYGVFLIGVVYTSREYVRLHPYEYVYFNSFVGGLKGAYGKYETDYWAKSNKEAVEWLKEYTSGRTNVGVYACAEQFQSTYYFSESMKFIDKRTADYHICFTRWNANREFDGEKVLFVVQREGVPLNYVMEAKK